MKKIGNRRFPWNSKETEKAPVVQELINATDTVWSVNQLAAILGTSKWAILKRIQRGTLPAHKDGSSWYILKSEYIEQLRKK